MEKDQEQIIRVDALVREKRKHVSYSEWGLFRECQHRWFLEYVEQPFYDQIRSAPDLVFGNAVHSAMEQLIKKTDEHDIVGAKGFFEETFKRLWTTAFPSFNMKGRDPEKAFVDFNEAGLRILEGAMFDDRLMSRDGWRVMSCEQRLDESISRTDDISKRFKGFIDLVISGPRGKVRENTCLWIVDFKTCSWGWPGWKKRDVHLTRQLLLYKHFLAKTIDVDQSAIKTAFVLLKKNKQHDVKYQIEWFEVASSPRVVAEAVEALQTDITLMHRDPFDMAKNTKACVNQFGDRCTYLGTDYCDAHDPIASS